MSGNHLPTQVDECWETWVKEIAIKYNLSKDDALRLIISTGVSKLSQRSGVGRPTKLNPVEESHLFELWSEGITQRELAEGYRASPATIGRIIRKWKPARR